MEVPSEERTDWLAADKDDCGYREFSEEEIVSIAREEVAENSEEENDDHEITSPTVSHASACQALQTVLTYLEQQPGYYGNTKWTFTEKESNKSKTNNNK